jgi:hypothetical protein
MERSTPLYAITGLILWFVITLIINVTGIQNQEILKVWGIENYKELQIIYKSDAYKQTQTEAILQLEAQLVQMVNQISTWDKDEAFADRE